MAQKSKEEFLNEMTQKAEQGNKDAQFLVGEKYWCDGKISDAMYFLRKSATQNQTDAQILLSKLLLFERVEGNTDVAIDEGLHWLCCAHLNGDHGATNVMNKLIDQYGDSWYHYIQHKIDDINRNLSTHGVKYVSKISSDSSSGGCYIATAVYGSYDADEVKVLRTFRDQILQKYMIGRALIKFYYAVSPPIAEKLKNAVYVNLFIRNILDSFVAFLRKKVLKIK